MQAPTIATYPRMGVPKFVEVEGIATRYYEAGAGEPLVLVHGCHLGKNDNVDCAENWDLNWEGFARSFHVFALDKLGQGYTDLPQDHDFTMAAIVRHTYGFLRALGLSGVHLVGHSRGGFVVTRLALEHPELVATCTIVDSNTTAPDETPTTAEERDAGRRGRLLRDAPKPLLSKESLRWVTRQFSYTDAHITEEWLDARVAIANLPKNRLAVDKMEAERLASELFLPKLAEQKAETLAWLREARLKTPTLLVWGKNDPSAVLAGGLALYELVAASVDRAQMHIFNQAGHYCYREHPEDFVAVVTAFIRGH